MAVTHTKRTAVASDMHDHAGSPGALADDRHFIGIAAEFHNMSLHPFHRSALVE
jgi:hypothetical protein